MSYIKFKELSKYFDFKTEVYEDKLPDYAKEYVEDNETILISNNEMIHTPDNIIANHNVVLTSFSDKWAGLRLTGIASYHTQGKYFDICNKYFNNETATPKGAIIIKINKVEGIA